MKLRYKEPGESTSKLINFPVQRNAIKSGALLARIRALHCGGWFQPDCRGGKYTGQWSYDGYANLAAGSIGRDRFGYVASF